MDPRYFDVLVPLAQRVMDRRGWEVGRPVSFDEWQAAVEELRQAAGRTG